MSAGPGNRVLLIFLVVCGMAHGQHSLTDSALALLPGLSSDTNKVNTLLQINRRLAAEGNIAAALDLTDRAIHAAGKNKPSKTFVVFVQRMVDECINHGNYPKGMELCFTVKHLAEQINEPMLKADAINSLGILYWYQGEYKKALSFFEDVLKLHEQMGSEGSAAGVLNNLGLIYRQMGDYDKAINYYVRSIYLSKKTGRVNGEANAYNNLGIVYHLKRDYTNALVYFERSLEIRKRIGDQVGIAISYGNIGSVYLDTKKYDEAERYYRNSYSISARLDDLEGIKETGMNLSDLFERKQMPDSALRYFKIYIAARDTLINEATKREALKREMEYRFEKEQERRKILADAEKRKQRIYLFSVCVVLLLISLFSIVLMKRFSVTKKQKKIIEEKNKEILDSIHYARRIQQSLLTSQRYIQKSMQRLRNPNRQ